MLQVVEPSSLVILTSIPASDAEPVVESPSSESVCETATPDHVPEIVTSPESSRARFASPIGAAKAYSYRSVITTVSSTTTSCSNSS
jgi:hypothetical protein